MSIPDCVRRYFDAWNAHDGAAIVACLAPDGTYEDPATGGPLKGDAVATYASGLWSALPDVHFDIESESEVAGRVAAQWLMRGTNLGSFNRLPPTGRTVRLPGADFIRVGSNGIESVRGYFDPGDMVKQLGLQVVVQPAAIGRLTFGTSTHLAAASPTMPGAFSITVLRARSDKEVERLGEYSRQVVMELPERDGFLGFLGAIAGDRWITLTAWEHPDQPRKMMKEGAHKEVMPIFFRELSAGGWTSVWTPERINQHWVRCTSCGQMEDAGATRTCRCGKPLPEIASFF